MGESKHIPAHYNQEDAETTLRFTINGAIIGMTHRTNIMDGSIVEALTESIYRAILNESTRWAVGILIKESPCETTDTE